MKSVKQTTTQKVHLVDGMFTPSEALDVIQSLIDQKINFHKLQRLSWREGQDDCNTDYPDGRISELLAEKKKIREHINRVRSSGNLIRINGVLDLSEVEI